MEYERIHKVQMGVISPSKLRMKLLGVHSSRRKEGGSNSSRTSPSKLEELEYAKDHLLSADLNEQSSLDHKCSIDLIHVASVDPKLELGTAELPSKERTGMTCSKSQKITTSVSYQIQSGGNLSTVHPMRSLEEDCNGYDSGHDNGSTSSFEFHRGERSLHHQRGGPFFRHLPSKWNDAEKWIVNRQSMHPNAFKKNVANSHGNHQISSHWVRNTPDMVSDTKRIDSTNVSSQNVVGKFSFVPLCLQPTLESANGMSESAGFSQAIGGEMEKEDDQKASISEKPISTVTASQTVESISMRDVGTEMTPIPSQEPSRTGTPMGATTPSRSPRSSLPASPKRVSVSSLTATAEVHENDCGEKLGNKESLERDLKLKTRREIAALGIQLGKMNIASWASKETESHMPSPKNFDAEQYLKAEYEARAAAWEEAEKAKHMARYKTEEIKIQAWESHQRSKIEAKMRKLEVQVERMRANGHEKIAQKVAETRREVEERRADAEAKKNQKAARTAHQVEQIRQTGRVPASHVRCCSWFL